MSHTPPPDITGGPIPTLSELPDIADDDFSGRAQTGEAVLSVQELPNRFAARRAYDESFVLQVHGNGAAAASQVVGSPA